MQTVEKYLKKRNELLGNAGQQYYDIQSMQGPKPIT